MSLLENYDILTMALLAGIGLLITTVVIFYSSKRYELAIALILMSPWAHWLFSPAVHEGDMESAAPTLGTYIRIAMVALAGVIGLLQLFKSKAENSSGNRWYLLLIGGFVIYALLSTVYSIDKKYTLVRSSEFLLFFFFLSGFYYWLKDKTRLDKTLNIYFMIMTCGIIVNLIALPLFPGRVWSWLMPGRFQGILEHPNSLGAFCMLTYPVLMWKYHRSSPIGKVSLLFLFCLVLFMHILSGSRASLAASILGFFMWFLIINKVNLNSLAKILSLFLITLFGVALLLQSRPASLNRGSQDITGLTGRTEFWQGCLQLVKEKPVTGYGYGVGGKIWADPRFYKAGQFLWSGSAKASLHNGYLSMAIGLGFVGLAIWLILVLVPAWRVMRLDSCDYKAFIVVMLFQSMVLNFFETSIVSGSQIITSLVFWLFLIMAQRMSFFSPFRSVNELQPVGFVPKMRRIYAT
jgi:O-antigen ligase